MENEIINVEEVETTGEGIANGSGKIGAIVIAGIGLTAILGGILYKKVIKPMIAKAKAKKAESELIEVSAENVSDAD